MGPNEYKMKSCAVAGCLAPVRCSGKILGVVHYTCEEGHEFGESMPSRTPHFVRRFCGLLKSLKFAVRAFMRRLSSSPLLARALRPATRILTFLFAMFVLTCAVGLPSQLMSSDSLDLFVVAILLFLPFVAFVAGVIFLNLLCIRRRLLRARNAVVLFASILVLSAVAFMLINRSLTPANISFAFSYPGNTGSYHAVQFYFKDNGQWLEGPSVEGWPLTVSFPDLNGDGYPDIRVVPNVGEGAVEFVFLPKNDGHVFWRPVKNDTNLSAAYEPANYFSNYP